MKSDTHRVDSQYCLDPPPRTAFCSTRNGLLRSSLFYRFSIPEELMVFVCVLFYDKENILLVLDLAHVQTRYPLLHDVHYGEHIIYTTIINWPLQKN